MACKQWQPYREGWSFWSRTEWCLCLLLCCCCLVEEHKPTWEEKRKGKKLLLFTLFKVCRNILCFYVTPPKFTAKATWGSSTCEELVRGHGAWVFMVAGDQTCWVSFCLCTSLCTSLQLSWARLIDKCFPEIAEGWTWRKGGCATAYTCLSEGCHHAHPCLCLHAPSSHLPSCWWCWVVRRCCPAPLILISIQCREKPEGDSYHWSPGWIIRSFKDFSLNQVVVVILNLSQFLWQLGVWILKVTWTLYRIRVLQHLILKAY